MRYKKADREIILSQVLKHSIFSLCLGAIIVIAAMKHGPDFSGKPDNEKNI